MLNSLPVRSLKIESLFACWEILVNELSCLKDIILGAACYLPAPPDALHTKL